MNNIRRDNFDKVQKNAYAEYEVTLRYLYRDWWLVKTAENSGGSRGGAVGAIAPVGWSDKIDFFTRLFPVFTDS